MRQSLSSDDFSLNENQNKEIEEKKETQKLGNNVNKPEKNLEIQGISHKQSQKTIPPGSKVISQQLKNQTPRSDIKQVAKNEALPSKSFGNISQSQGLKINNVNRSKSKNNIVNYPITPNIIVQPKENQQETILHPKSLKKNEQKPKSQSTIRSTTKKAEQKSLDSVQKGTLAKNVLEEYAEQVNQTQQKAKAQSDLQRQFKKQQDKTQKFIQSSRILKSFNSKNKQ